MPSTCKIGVASAVVLACTALAAASSHPFYRSDGHDLGGSDDDPHSSHSYHFQYAVHDPLTGDIKDQNEVGDGRGGVKGTYSLIEADGSKRVVEYTADDAHGFRAEVKRIEAAGHDGSTAGLGYQATAGHGYQPTAGHGYQPTTGHEYQATAGHEYQATAGHGYPAPVSEDGSDQFAHRTATE